MPRLIKGSSKVFMLLALFVAGSVLSVTTSLVQSDAVSARTAAQRTYCMENFPVDKIITIITINGSPPMVTRTESDPPQDWVDNDCASMCDLKDGMEKISPVKRVAKCNPDAPLTIEASTAMTDAVKKGYGDLAAKELCGGDAQCEATMRGYVETCIDEYVQNAPANAPEFPLVDTVWLVNECMARDGKLDASQANKLRTLFLANKEKIATKAKATDEAAQQKACEDDGGTWVEESSECGTKVVCASSIQGIGWLVCPAMNFMADISDRAYAFLASKFLSVDVDLVKGVRDSWAKFRDIANIALVIALLIVIYSQITSVGISNYGIKKMLPKIVVAAILVNVSYDICRIAVDLSNILGYGIAKFFEGNFGFISTPSNSTTLDTLGNGLSIAGAVGAALAGAVGIAMAVSVPVVLSAILAVGLIVLILLAREALIILLIAIAPLAFVAYLLPNTEQWYKKWLKLFSTLLLLFPIIGLVFGASKLAATILLNAGAAQSPTDKADVMTQVLAVGVLVIPFFVVPGLLKGALNAAGSIGTKLSGMADKASGKVSSRGKSKAEERFKRSGIARGYASGKAARAAARNAKYAKRVNSGEGFTAATARMGAKLGGGSAGITALNRSALTAASKEEAEDVQAAKLEMEKQGSFINDKGEVETLTNSNGLAMARAEFKRAMATGDHVKARAAQDILTHSGSKGLGELQKAYEELGSGSSVNLGGGKTQSYDYGSVMRSDAGQKSLSDLNSAGLKGKNVALDQFSRADMSGTATKMGDLQKASGTYAGLNASEFVGQSADNLDLARESGALTPKMAQTIKDSEVYASLDPGKMRVIEEAAMGDRTVHNADRAHEAAIAEEARRNANP